MRCGAHLPECYEDAIKVLDPFADAAIVANRRSRTCRVLHLPHASFVG